MTQAFPKIGRIADEKGFVTPEFRKLLVPLEVLSQISPAQLSKLLGIADESGSILDASTGAAQGDIPFRGDGIWDRLPIGAIGALLGINAAGNAPEWQQGGWLNFISETDASGANVNITGFDDYNHVLIRCNNISTSGAGTIKIEFVASEGPALVAYSRAFITAAAISGFSDASAVNADIGSSSGAADNFTATIFIPNIKSGKDKSSFSWSQSNTPNGMLVITHIFTSLQLTELNINPAAGTFTNGSISLYGIK